MQIVSTKNVEEIVDIVDGDNAICFQTSKVDAHKKGLLHQTVIGEIRCSDGRIILVKQSADRQDAGQFVSPVGGHVRAGEKLIDALKRETQEELGASDFEYKFIGKAIFNREVLARLENHYFIVYEIYIDDVPNLGDEAVEYRYFTEKELKDLLRKNSQLFGGGYHFVVKNFYSHLLNEK